jgi:hypothetical protein
MAWQFAIGLVIGGAIVAGLTIALVRVVPAGTFIGLLGLAAAVEFAGTLVSAVRTYVSSLTLDTSGGFFTDGGKTSAWWCLAGVALGTVVTIAVIRSDAGEPSAARASTPRFLALGGLTILLASAATASDNLGFGDRLSNGDQLVYWAGLGISLGLAALAFGTRADQPESPSYVALMTIIGAALLGLLAEAINSPTRLDPLLLGTAAIPVLVGGVVALTGLIRPLSAGSGRSIALLSAAGLGVLLVVSLIEVAIVGGAALFGAGIH